MENGPHLFNDVLRERGQHPVEAQPGVVDTAVVEGGLRQREPGAAVPAPEWRQLHLSRRCVLVDCWGQSWWDLRVAEAVCSAVLAVSPGEVVVAGWPIVVSLHIAKLLWEQ